MLSISFHSLFLCTALDKDKLNPYISGTGLVLTTAETILLFVYDLMDLTFGIALIVMFALLIWNIRKTVHMTLAFASAVGWMIIAIYNFPQASEVTRIWEFSDFLPALVCALNFALGAWMYVYNRVRW